MTRRQILGSSKLKEFADDNFMAEKLEKWQKVIQMGRKHCGERRNCSLRTISPFPTVFSKGLFPRGVKRCHCVGIGYVELQMSVKDFYQNNPMRNMRVCVRTKGLNHLQTIVNA